MPPPSPGHHWIAVTATALIVAAAAGVFVWLHDPGPPPPSGDRQQTTSEPPRGAVAATPPRTKPEPTEPSPSVQSSATIDVRLRVDIAGGELERVSFIVEDLTGTQRAAAEGGHRDGHFAAVLTVPADVWLDVAAMTFSTRLATPALALPTRVRLGPGETRRIEMTIHGEPTVLRIAGPSRALLEHLSLELTGVDAGAARQNHRIALRLPDGDRVLCHLPEGPLRAQVPLGEGDPCPLQTATGDFEFSQHGGEVLLTPIEPLAGVCFGSPRIAAPAALALDRAATPADVRTCLTVLQSRIAASKNLHGWTQQLGPLVMPLAKAVRDGDLWYLEPRLATSLAMLVVHIDATSTSTNELDLLVEPLDGGPPTKLDRERNLRRATLADGDHRLVWNVRGGPGPVALDRISLLAGRTTELHLQPLPLQRWRVQLRGADLQDVSALFCELGGVHSLGGARDGVFEMDLARPPRANEAGSLWSQALKARFPATISAVDERLQHAQIDSPVSEAIWTRIRVEAMAGGKVTLRLQPMVGIADEPNSYLTPDTKVPLLPGLTRDGCVMEHIEGRDQLVAWFRLEHGVREKLVRGQGRWATLQILPTIASGRVFASRSAGIDAVALFRVDRAGEYPVFIADGTMQLLVDLRPGGRYTLDANAPLIVPR